MTDNNNQKPYIIWAWATPRPNLFYLPCVNHEDTDQSGEGSHTVEAFSRLVLKFVQIHLQLPFNMSNPCAEEVTNTVNPDRMLLFYTVYSDIFALNIMTSQLLTIILQTFK